MLFRRRSVLYPVIDIECAIFGDAHIKELVEAFLVRGTDEPFEGGEEGDIRDPGFACAFAVALQILRDLGCEIVADNSSAMLATELDQFGAICQRDVRIIDDNRAAGLQCLLDQLALLAGAVAVVAEKIFAHVYGVGGKTLLIERAFARRLQANQDDQFQNSLPKYRQISAIAPVQMP